VELKKSHLIQPLVEVAAPKKFILFESAALSVHRTMVEELDGTNQWSQM